MTSEQLNKILYDHDLWLKGKGGSRANLYGADLSGADLSGANLSRANLSGANLSGAYMPMYCKWSVGIQDNKVFIGCKAKTIKEWDVFFYESKKEYDTPRESEDFKRILASYEAVKAYRKVLGIGE